MPGRSTVNLDVLPGNTSHASDIFKSLAANRHSSLVSAVVWSPDGQHLVSGSHDGDIKVWDMFTHSCTKHIRQAHAGPISSMSWAAHANFLASADQNAFLKIWNFTDDGEILEEHKLSLSEGTSLLVFVAWAPHAGVLAAACSDGRTKIWKVLKDVRGKPQLNNLPSVGGIVDVRSVSWSPCDQKLACAGPQAIICENLDSNPSNRISLPCLGPPAFRSPWCSVSWCPDRDRCLLAAGNVQGEVVIWNLTDKKYRWLAHHPSKVQMIAWGPGSQLILSGSSDGTIHISDTSQTRDADDDGKMASDGRDRCDCSSMLWSYSVPDQPEMETRGWGSLAWAPDGQRVAIGKGNGEIIFQRPPGRVVGVSRCHKEELQVKFGVLLSEWANDVAPDQSKPLPALAFDGRLVTTSRKEWIKFPDSDLTSFVAAVTVDFDHTVLMEETKASVNTPKCSVPCNLSIIWSAMTAKGCKGPNPCRALYIVFRGARFINNWLQNMNLQPNKEAYRMHGLNVHASFHQEIENRRFLESADFTKVLSGAAQEGSDLIFTGHSAGGAHAVTLFSDLTLRKKTQLERLLACSRSSTKRMLESARFIVFGAPTVFAKENSGESFSRSFSNAMERGRNYVLRDDPVPRCYSKFPDWGPEMTEKLKETAVSELRSMLPWIVRPSTEVITGQVETMDVDRFLAGLQFDDTKALARSYFHSMEIVVVAGGGRDWAEFEVTPASMQDHHITSYADFLCMLTHQKHQTFPEPL